MKEKLLKVVKNLKSIFKSKDKKLIIKSIGDILLTIFIAIIIKMPFIFVKTIILDTMNSSDVSYSLQNGIAFGFEVIYFLVALIVIYKYFVKYFGND